MKNIFYSSKDFFHSLIFANYCILFFSCKAEKQIYNLEENSDKTQSNNSQEKSNNRRKRSTDIVINKTEEGILPEEAMKEDFYNGIDNNLKD